MATFRKWVFWGFSIDLRALSLLRIGLGIVMVGTILSCFVSTEAFLSDTGIVPRELLFRAHPFPYSLWKYSLIHFVSGSWVVQTLLLAFGFGLGVALILGWHTAIVTPLCWYYILSLHSRNPEIINGSDTYLRVLLFWGIWLPWGRLFSIDALKNPQTTHSSLSYFSPATVILLLQVATLYLIAGLQKTGPEWSNGSAVEYVLNSPEIVRPFGKWLVQFPSLMRWLTHGTVWVELIAFPLLFIPLGGNRLRLTTVGLLAFMHLGFTLALPMGNWTWLPLLALLVFIPGPVWQALFSAPCEMPQRSAPTKLAFGYRRIRGLGFMALFVFLIVSSLNGLSRSAYPLLGRLDSVAVYRPLSEIVRVAAQILGISQKWNMFAPSPTIIFGDYGVEGNRGDGRWISLLNAPRESGRSSVPRKIRFPYNTDQWDKFFFYFRQRLSTYPTLAQYFCRREGNENPTVPLREVKFTSGSVVLATYRCK